MELSKWFGNTGFDLIHNGKIVASVQGVHLADNLESKSIWWLYNLLGYDISDEHYMYRHRSNAIRRVTDALAAAGDPVRQCDYCIAPLVQYDATCQNCGAHYGGNNVNDGNA
jgi:hypothetical protein